MMVDIVHQGFGSPSWHMQINLQHICELEGKKADIYTDRGNFIGRRVVYPVTRVRKMLKLIFQECDQGTIEQVQQYLNSNSKIYGKEFEKIRSKGR